MNTKSDNKNSILLATLVDIFSKNMNLAQIKFFYLFIIELCKVQTVSFEKIACILNLGRFTKPKLFKFSYTEHFNLQFFCKLKQSKYSFETASKPNSSLQRIQQFMSEYTLNTDIIAILALTLLLEKPSFHLAMDRDLIAENQCIGTGYCL